ncbi:unnamed protein product [Adineta steineri]|uniref:Apple domain-containing protein n=1 Tax=Adineta steineri TaxID=433720 RepID=A0A814W9Q4_9BILA|nr:unnamed protein product [Adineta steineri]CAF3968414.1 unnamed protein product [Adineta steineri]
MAFIRFLFWLLFFLIEQIPTQDIRSFEMSIMTGWQLQCANTTCLPFIIIRESDIYNCQRACLAQINCQAASFQQSTSTCELYGSLTNYNSYMSAHTDIVTMIVNPETRIPSG